MLKIYSHCKKSSGFIFSLLKLKQSKIFFLLTKNKKNTIDNKKNLKMRAYSTEFDKRKYDVIIKWWNQQKEKNFSDKRELFLIYYIQIAKRKFNRIS